METNAIVQAVLLAILPLVMQGLKQFAWIEKNKNWFAGLFCIASAAAIAFFMGVENWLLVGVMTGAASNKVYDWFGDTVDAAKGPPSMMGMLLLIPLVLLAGCNGVCWMSASYKNTVKAESIAINYLDAACQKGDPDACKEGLHEAAGAFEDILTAAQ